jgi:hypothetical protein
MRGKIVYGGEWVKVANHRNKYFNASAPCSYCRYCTTGPVWYNIKTHEVRCLKCFTPPGSEKFPLWTDRYNALCPFYRGI